jgi:hypothetical protein
MSNIECSTTYELSSQNSELLDILESISSIPIKTYSQELITFIRNEDKLYEIPQSIIEVIHQNGK